MLHNTYDEVLDGSYHTQEEAIAWANDIVWTELALTVDDIKADYIATVQGDVGIWYDHTGDYYFFTEEKSL